MYLCFQKSFCWSEKVNSKKDKKKKKLDTNIRKSRKSEFMHRNEWKWMRWTVSFFPMIVVFITLRSRPVYERHNQIWTERQRDSRIVWNHTCFNAQLIISSFFFALSMIRFLPILQDFCIFRPLMLVVKSFGKTTTFPSRKMACLPLENTFYSLRIAWVCVGLCVLVFMI